ncbi:MAG: Lrp/AsnC family transcriptional regulator [Candidatus Adiutrix sp.]|jgi:DNA-binding Lrp family transcriptional regulator|nr:Lrp/AsnC family transcriptional regulator [Candidatus Adiutrix sp.]
MVLDEADKRLIHLLSGDLGDSPAPYAEAAAKAGLTEEEALASVRRFMDAGLIRRLGATLWHQRSGFSANAMVVFSIPADRVEECGRKLAGRERVSHCYLRKTAPGWPFNLYAMTHAHNRDELLAAAREMADDCQAEDWRMLESLRELKKASLRYFAEYSVA